MINSFFTNSPNSTAIQMLATTRIVYKHLTSTRSFLIELRLIAFLMTGMLPKKNTLSVELAKRSLRTGHKQESQTPFYPKILSDTHLHTKDSIDYQEATCSLLPRAHTFVIPFPYANHTIFAYATVA